MAVRVAINGFGRIGRNVLRAIIESGRTDIQVVAINDLGPVETNAHLLRFDSVHGRFPHEVKVKGDTIDVGLGPITVTAIRNPAELPHKAMGVEIALECTGIFTSKEKAKAHLEAGAKRVLVSAPADNVDLTVVYGVPSPPSGTWKDYLTWDERALVQKETHPRDPRAQEAICRYQVVETLDGASLVEVRLVTGRRNQIRLQARLHGHTLVGESRYTYGPDTLRPISFPRQALHAFRLGFRHPSTGYPLTFESPLPDDMKELIENLRRKPKPGNPFPGRQSLKG